MHRPVAPLLTRNGLAVVSKVGDTILVFNVGSIPSVPVAAARVRDDSCIPGGPTIHTDRVHHDRDTHHKRTFGSSFDGKKVAGSVAGHRAIEGIEPRSVAKLECVPVDTCCGKAVFFAVTK